MTGESRVFFSKLRCQCAVSEEERREAQGAFRMAPGNSGLHAHGKGERVIALESWEGLGPQEAFKKDSHGLSWVGAGNTHFPRPLQGTLGNFPGASER